MIEDGPICIDVSQDQRDWGEVVPDLWFYPDHVMGKELELVIKTAELEQYPNAPPKPFLTFENDPKRLGLSREHRLMLRSLFGPPEKCIGQTITITAGPNAMRTIVIKILPRSSPIVTRPQLALADDPLLGNVVSPPGPDQKPRKRSRREIED